MKKEFQIKIYKDNFLLKSLVEIIGNHNENDNALLKIKENDLTLDDLNGYIRSHKYYLSSLRNLVSEIVMDELVVMTDGENVSFIIQEKILVELDEKGVEI